MVRVIDSKIVFKWSEGKLAFLQRHYSVRGFFLLLHTFSGIYDVHFNGLFKCLNQVETMYQTPPLPSRLFNYIFRKESKTFEATEKWFTISLGMFSCPHFSQACGYLRQTWKCSWRKHNKIMADFITNIAMHV